MIFALFLPFLCHWDLCFENVIYLFVVLISSCRKYSQSIQLCHLSWSREVKQAYRDVQGEDDQRCFYRIGLIGASRNVLVTAGLADVLSRTNPNLRLLDRVVPLSTRQPPFSSPEYSANVLSWKTKVEYERQNDQYAQSTTNLGAIDSLNRHTKILPNSRLGASKLATLQVLWWFPYDWGKQYVEIIAYKRPLKTERGWLHICIKRERFNVWMGRLIPRVLELLRSRLVLLGWHIVHWFQHAKIKEFIEQVALRSKHTFFPT